MKKIIFLLIYILAVGSLYGCGYKPLYSSNEFLFKIDEITHNGTKIEKQIAKSLESMSNNESSSIINFNLSSSRDKIIVSKNKNGDPEIFELKISINIKVLNKQKTFMGKQVYKSIENKFQLKEFELQIEKQIMTKLMGEIIFFSMNLS